MIEVLQVPSELEQMVALYRRCKPRRVLEIGSWQGGTMQVWLREGKPERVVAVDLNHQRPELYAKWRKPGTKVSVITGSSQDASVKDEIRALGPYDWLLVDGDHGEDAVRSDVALAMECAAEGAVLLMHDITRGRFNEGDPGPRIVLEELREQGYVITEFVEEPYDGHWAHGTGVVQL